ncbi:dual specificity phosphatase [Lasallia pustulata]|uniref:phosphatidylinositol-3,4,5-trisphosphate 3-phosphatase n=1 Tax=Lasallia pustulata TaxID=136370 RepID=A0A1W5CSN2_9LECA|nr:dual specificity phosphatase [Lasallia pustulata]
MVSIIQPRHSTLRHPEAGLDLCYVTDNIIATSGPSSTYPQRAYRNPTDALVRFLDSKHGTNWAIWEFRAEGTGYPDSEVYNRIRHYPWPDHHPPPFAIIPNIMASMRNWLKDPAAKHDGRVVVVHCKAGKGRSGTVACSYLISEEGWAAEDALKRFTERRMRQGFGAGISIPSQMRWIGYVDRWAKHGKLYVERQVEVLEVHVWGLRDGVKVAVEGFVDEGRTIKLFHVFTKDERIVMDDTAQSQGTFARLADVKGDMRAAWQQRTPQMDRAAQQNRNETLQSGDEPQDGDQTGTESGGSAVIFRPSTRVVLPSNDINIDFERRNKAAYGWTMVTSVAHVWFNAFFEGQGPENGGFAGSDGVFEIEWGAMDGIRGSSRKGTRSLDRLAVVWRALDGEREGLSQIIREPKQGEPVPETSPADWKGSDGGYEGLGRDLGLRVQSPSSAEASKASSIKSSQSEKTATNEDDDPVVGVKAHGPDGEEHIPRWGGSLAAASESHVASSSLTSPTGSDRTRHPALEGMVEIVTGAKQISTNELPGGMPEEVMTDSKEHLLGNLKKSNDVNFGS